MKITNQKSQITIFFLIAPLLLGATNDIPQPRLPPEPVLTIGEVLRAAMERNPDLLNVLDALRTARVASSVSPRRSFRRFLLSTPRIAAAIPAGARIATA